MGFSVDLVSLVIMDMPTSFESFGCFVMRRIMGRREFVRSIDGSPDKYKTLVVRA